jgi:energy-coupling factor transporter ATP-binding protein EcfA2
MAERLRWNDVLSRVDWRQGEHVTLLGPTGAGKTVAAMSLLAERERRQGAVLALVTKPRDSVPEILFRRGYEKIKAWPPPKRRKCALLWPRYRGPRDLAEQQETVATMLSGAFRDGSWCVYVDELYWVSNRLNLAPWLRDYWLLGRSMGLTLVTGAQRPRNVPREAYPNSAHLLIWRTADDDDLRRLAGLGAANSKEVRNIVAHLDFDAHEVLWVDARRGDLYVTQAPLVRS